jgi:hypothetical protein
VLAETAACIEPGDDFATRVRRRGRNAGWSRRDRSLCRSLLAHPALSAQVIVVVVWLAMAPSIVPIPIAPISPSAVRCVHSLSSV